MGYTENFNDMKNDINGVLNSNVQEPLSAEPEPTREPEYPVEGKSLYMGERLGKQYQNLKLHASAVHRMPGQRARWIDAVMRIWNKKAEYYALFLRGFLGLGVAAAWFLLIPMPYAIIAYAFVFYGFLKLMEGHNHRLACWKFEMNMGYVKGLAFDPNYGPKGYWGKDKVLGK